MKHQQVTVDMTDMVFTAFSYLALAGAVWVLLRLVQACFWLPKHMKRQNDVQRMLQEKVDSYEKYVLECEEKERTEMLDQIDDEKKNLEMSKKWKERRECLDMLKHELERVTEGKEDTTDWDKMLDEELKKYEEMESKIPEENEEEEEEEGEERKNLKNNAKKEKIDNEKESKKIKIDTEPKKEK